MAKKISSKKVTKKSSILKPSKVLKVPPVSQTRQPAKALVAIGKKVPAFSLPSTEGADFELTQKTGKSLVLFFYPKDCTPGCTIEGADFTRLHKKFSKLSAEVYGISRDKLSLHEKFRAKESYSAHLLSDEEEVACGIFGVVKEKNMYGKKVWGIERSTFVLNSEGVLIKEWRKVSVDGHAEEVLEFIKSGLES